MSHDASRPTAQNDVWGWSLRTAPGHVLTCSAIRPIEMAEEVVGSKAGRFSRMHCHHCGGTSGSPQREGSLFSGVWLGHTSVPSSPRTSSSASTTDLAPPQ